MNPIIRRIYVEKREDYNVESDQLFREFTKTLQINHIRKVRVLNRYDFISDDESLDKIKSIILSEPNMDVVYDNDFFIGNDEKSIAIEYLPGQYDQRADSASQCIQIITHKMNTKVKVAKIILIEGLKSQKELDIIKNYCINPVDSRQASMQMYKNLDEEAVVPLDVEIIDDFITFNEEQLKLYKQSMGFAMSINDILFVQKYFAQDEKRNPTITELKVIDTYWSDHCRHTTFSTEIEDVKIEEGPFYNVMQNVLNKYLESKRLVAKNKPITLMDLATINMKEARLNGLLDDLDVSDEINACSIQIQVDVNDQEEEWLLMFKNETHNHPTEIEPFGGAATCLGGAIRDPLSGRSYVYQAMRISGSGDPRKPINETLSGKLPQRKISKEAAKGFSSYGNQIGLATGQVVEIYHEGYVAKRMEIGAVIGAAPKENVVRSNPVAGDIILLIGGRTGRDGCGGATGSSKAHNEESLALCGAEVQKGNPPEERKIQRLFRNSEVSKLIKKCNDFGAGGVSVAIGELADSLEIDLDLIPKKYDGLDGTELAISESQERMAVVVSKEHVGKFIKYCGQENLEISQVAKVTDNNRLIMKWRGKKILDLSRDFLDTNGAKQFTKVIIKSPKEGNIESITTNSSIQEKWMDILRNLNVCSQQGLSEMFDSTIGSGSVVMPYGGKYCLTPADGMVAKIPTLKGETNTCSIMGYGYNASICEWSPFHGGIYAILESVAKVVAMGGDYKKVRLSMQEYFERLGKDYTKWGKPFSALLGAYHAQKELGLAAIGGKDSMSGSFNDLSVPPTVVAFSVAVDKTDNIITPEFKIVDSKVYLIKIQRDNNQIPDFENVKYTYGKIKELVDKKVIISAKTISQGGIAAAISKMTFGNKIGFTFTKDTKDYDLFNNNIGDMIVESNSDIVSCFKDMNCFELGITTTKRDIKISKNVIMDIDELIKCWQKPLEKVYPIYNEGSGNLKTINYITKSVVYSGEKIAKPRVFIPIFPGTNCEYDSIRAFENAGAIVNSFVFRNKSHEDIVRSLKEMTKLVSSSQILMIPGGFSAGDEPDGSGKFIATVFRNPYLKDAVMELLKNRDGLALGICNGFQALIKLGLLPYGEIKEIKEDSPTLTFNTIGRHVSCMPITKVVSNLSPWFNKLKVGDCYRVPMSHGEGRFVANEEVVDQLISSGQIATQYVDFDGKATYNGQFNPNGSIYAVEGITSPDGRVLGKMGHSERITDNTYINIPEIKKQNIFESGVEYFG
ncbi:MAG: phosphoribosylformylglycinamidine synthase [Eubacteriaceae bacterium]